jgi:hypothetical protein
MTIMPMNHSQSCSRSGASDAYLAAGQPRPDLVGNREVHDDDGAAEDQMEVRVTHEVLCTIAFMP